jgi:hippurate hydrolase
MRGVPPTINAVDEAAFAAGIGDQIVGDDKVDREPELAMGSEDFSIMLAKRPGAFVWLGGGAPGKDYGLHHPKYDFNDEVLPVGASFFAKVVESKLPRG